MKKTLSLLLSIALLLSIVPFGAVQAAAANGRIYADQEVSVYCGSVGTWDVRTFIPEEDGIYIFSSSGSMDTLGYIALAEGEAENENIKYDGGQDDNFAVTYEMTAGTTYYLGSTLLTGKGSYTVKVIKFEIDDGTIHQITLSQSTPVTTNKTKNVKFFSITPATSGKYVYLSSGNYDTQGYIFDEFWRQIAYSDGGGAAQNFQIELDLQAGKTYYIGYAVTSLTNATFNVLLYMTSYIQSISLLSAPAKTSYIKGIDAKYISGITYHVDLNLSEFTFKINYSNGSTEDKEYIYGIRGLDCDTSRDLLEGANDVRFSYMGNQSSFRIYITDSPVDSLTAIQPPDKTVYYDEDVEEALDGTKIFNISISGMILRAHYKNGTTKDFAIESLYGQEIDYLFFDHMRPASQMHLGDNSFTVFYYDVPLTFSVKYSLNSDNWEFEVNDDEVTLTKYIGTDTQALIPEALSGYPVTKIGDECFKDNTSLKGVRMTERITSIGENAFFGCTALKELTLPSSLTSIGKQACYGLRNLEKLTWNAPNLSILKANNTFAYMGADLSDGTTVEFGFTCQAIPQDCFYNSSNTYAPNIFKIIVGENVETIGNNAFRELVGLRLVEWNALQINDTLGAANNIWANSGGTGSFEVYVGENVITLPKYLFYASNAARMGPRISKMQVEGKDTVISADTFKTNTNVPITYYCRYNEDSSTNCVYNYCVNNQLDYVLLDAPVDHIYLRAQLQKDEYIIGEDLDLTGLSVYAVYEDMTEQDVTDKIEVIGYDKTYIGVQQLTISYTFIDKTVTVPYEVLVTEEPLVLDYVYIASPSQDTEFFAGDVFQSTGLQLNAVFTNGMVQDVSDFMILSGYDMSTAGNQSVAVSYTYEGVTRTANYSILVKELVLTNLILHTAPDKKDYLVGESLNVDGLKVIALYNSGRGMDVSNLCEFSGYDLNTKGAQTVTVLYSENGTSKTCSYGITVHNLLLGITIEKLPNKVEFVKGAGFSAAGIVVKADFENGTQLDVSDALTFSGYNMNTPGEQEVTVTYTDGETTKTDTYTITVSEKTLLRLQLSAAPSATQYQGEPLDITGLNISAIFNDATRENVAQSCVFSGYNMEQTGAQTVTAAYTWGETTLTVTFPITVVSRTATGIALVTLPQKTAYMVGEALDTSGISAKLLFDDGSQKAIDSAALTYTGYNKNQPGEQTVTVNYSYKANTFHTSFTVTVTNFETGITVSAPDKTEYFYGDALDTTGMSVTATMADGSTQTIRSGYTVSGHKKNVLGLQTVTISYTSAVTGQHFSDSFLVTVLNYETAIAVSAPDKTDYYYGDSLDTTGIGALITMADGTQRHASPIQLQTSGYNATRLGEQSITVNYTGVKGDVLSDSFAVQVHNFEAALEVTAPTKTAYFYGESLNTAGMSAKAVMADGSKVAVETAALTVSGYSKTTLGEQSVVVKMTGVKGNEIADSFTVTVANYETALCVTAPTKTAYFYGDAFDTSGMSAVAVMADGSEQTVAVSALQLSGYNAQTLGEQTITARYTNAKGATLSDSFAVTVNNFETLLSVTAPTKCAYYYGEALDTSGMSAQLSFADGSTRSAALSELECSAFDPYSLGNQTITLSYLSEKGEVLSDSYTVTVNNFEQSLQVSAPTKTVYDCGEALNTEGMLAVITMADGSQRQPAAAELTLSGYQANVPGEQTVTVSFTNVKGDAISSSFDVTVVNYETGITVTPPTRTEYYFGEELNTSGMSVKATMADGTQKQLSLEEVQLTGYDKNSLGEQTVTVSFTSSKGEVFTDSFTVTVSNFLTGLNVIPPTKLSYFYGENLNTTGMSATLTDAAGESTQIDVSKLRLNGYNSRKLGEQTITVSYTSDSGVVFTDSFKVVVLNYEKSITVSAPDKTEYFYGDSLDTAGLSATAVMADNSTKEIAGNELIVFGYSSTKLGTQTVNVMYKNAKNMTLSGSFSVVVNNYEKALSVIAPTKTEYDYAEALDLSGLGASVTMANGQTQEVDADTLHVLPHNPERLGWQTVTVEYTNLKGEVLTDTFSVLVRNYPVSLSLSGNYPTEFTQGDVFSTSGMKVLVHYADGSKHDVTDAVSFEGYDMAAVGEQTVSVLYAEGEKQVSTAYPITVNKYESEKQRCDVNEDGFIDIADVSLVLASVNYGLPKEQAAYLRADVDRNGVVNISDVNLLLKAENFGQYV